MYNRPRGTLRPFLKGARQDGPPLARRPDRGRGPRRVHIPDRDPQGLEGQVRAGQGDGALEGRPYPVLVRGLPRQLRLYPEDSGRRQGPARRAGPDAGTGPTPQPPEGATHRDDAHGRRRRERREDHLRPPRRSRIPNLRTPQRAARTPADRAPALFPGLQGARRQAGGRGQLLGPRRSQGGRKARGAPLRRTLLPREPRLGRESGVIRDPGDDFACGAGVGRRSLRFAWRVESREKPRRALLPTRYSLLPAYSMLR